METRDFDRIRFVTRHFHELQGLRCWVPAGMIALSLAGVADSANPALLAVRATLFLGAFALMLSAGRFYKNTFGEVERQPVRSSAQLSSLSIFSPAGTPQLNGSRQEIPAEERFVLITALTVAALALFHLLFWPPWIKLDSVIIVEPFVSFAPGPPALDRAFPVAILDALCGSLFLATWLARQRRLSQCHHLALGILLLGLSALPVASRLWVTLLLSGSSMVLAGLLDHRQLVRALGPAVEPSQE